MREASGTVSHKDHGVMGDTGLVFAIMVGFQAPSCKQAKHQLHQIPGV